MDEKDWELLVALHEEHSITKAAKRLFITQPTASEKIKQLEREFGCTIVIRSVRGITFTPQGDLLYQFSTQYLQDFRHIKNALQTKSKEMTGTLSIGCASLYGKYKMANVLTGFCKKYPAINVRLHTNMSQNIYDMLCSGIVQVAIVRGNYPWSGKKYVLQKAPYCIVNLKPLDMKKLPTYPMVFRHGDRPLQSVLNNWWLSHFDSPPYIRVEVNNLDMCMQMVRQGLGYTLLAAAAPIPDVWTHELYDTNEQLLTRSTWLYLSEQSENNPVVMAFYKYLINYEKKHLWQQ